MYAWYIRIIQILLLLTVYPLEKLITDGSMNEGTIQSWVTCVANQLLIQPTIYPTNHTIGVRSRDSVRHQPTTCLLHPQTIHASCIRMHLNLLVFHHISLRGMRGGP